MKRTILAGAVAIVAVSAGVSAAVVSATHHEAPTPAKSSTPTHASTTQVLHFTSVSTSSGYVDNAKKGWSIADVLTQHSKWLQGDNKVADMALTATVTQRTSDETGEVLFQAVAGLDGGDVSLTGKFDVTSGNQTFAAAVTGGTGTYAGVRGHAVFKQVPGDKTLVTLYLQR